MREPMVTPPEKTLLPVKVFVPYVFGMVVEEWTKYCADVVLKELAM